MVPFTETVRKLKEALVGIKSSDAAHTGTKFKVTVRANGVSSTNHWPRMLRRKEFAPGEMPEE